MVGLKSPKNVFGFFLLIPLHDMRFFLQTAQYILLAAELRRSSSDADAVAAARAPSCLRHTTALKRSHLHTRSHTNIHPARGGLDFNATSGCHIECGSVGRGGGSGGSGARGRQKRLWSQRQQRRRRRRRAGEGGGQGERSGLGFWTKVPYSLKWVKCIHIQVILFVLFRVLSFGVWGQMSPHSSYHLRPVPECTLCRVSESTFSIVMHIR